MSDRSAIEWTDASWNPIRARNLKTGKIGWHCAHATTGCEFCYAEGINKRLGTGLPFKPGHRADVEIFLDEDMLLAPLRWRRPRRIFVGSMTDMFADFVTDAMLDRVFAVMRECPRHTFQVLTKRAERLRSYVSQFDQRGRCVCSSTRDQIGDDPRDGNRLLLLDDGQDWPLSNLWLGVSCEHQEEADERIPLLLQTPAAVRFISAEPLLGSIDLTRLPFAGPGDPRHRRDALTGESYLYSKGVNGNPNMTVKVTEPLVSQLDWIIVGGESGPSARPMNPDWARSLRDQCKAAGTAFFFKQWGEWIGNDQLGWLKPDQNFDNCRMRLHDGGVIRVGKKAAGRLLDGQEHNAYPEGRE
jgi:protein gp37